MPTPNSPENYPNQPLPSLEEQRKLHAATNLKIMNWLDEIDTLGKVKKQLATRFFNSYSDILDRPRAPINPVALAHDLADNENYALLVDVDGEIEGATCFSVIFDNDDFIEEIMLGAKAESEEGIVFSAYAPFNKLDLSFLEQAASAFITLVEQGRLPNLADDFYDIESRSDLHR